MGEGTAIEWADHTFNPWWGCARVSPACRNCYAETWARGLPGYSGRPGKKPLLWGTEAPRRLMSDLHWAEPLAWDRKAEEAGRPALVFCASMADVFEARPDPPLDLAHARALRVQCSASGVPFFFKQVGGARPGAGGHELDGELLQTWPTGGWAMTDAVSATRRPDREHGTYACYVHGPIRPGPGQGCRCELCRAANREHCRAAAARTVPPYVSATSAREHLAFLAAQGVGLKTVAKVSGLAHGTLSKLVYGDGTRGTAPSRRIRRATRDAILAVTPSQAPAGSRVPAGPTLAIVDRLLDRGWTKAAIARAIGQRGPGLQLGSEVVTRGHARAVAALLDEPVPPRRSRHGLHPVPQPVPVDPQEKLRDEARRAGVAERQAAYRATKRDTPPAGTDPAAGDEPAPAVDDLVGVRAVWMRRAACRRPEVPTWLFYVDEDDDEGLEAARAVCRTCPVQHECLTAAVAGAEPGMWAGTTERDRAGLRRGQAS